MGFTQHIEVEIIVYNFQWLRSHPTPRITSIFIHHECVFHEPGLMEGSMNYDWNANHNLSFPKVQANHGLGLVVCFLNQPKSSIFGTQKVTTTNYYKYTEIITCYILAKCLLSTLFFPPIFKFCLNQTYLSPWTCLHPARTEMNQGLTLWNTLDLCHGLQG